MKPALVKIVLTEEQIYANRPITARCETWGSSPAARVVWRLGRQVIGDSNVSTTQRSNSTVSKLPLILGKDDNGRKLTCRAENPRFPGGVLEQTEIVDVACECAAVYPCLLPPLPSISHSFRWLSSDGPVVSIDLATGYVLDTLREGDDLKLVCDVDSNPPPTGIVWYHKVRGIKFLPP